MNEHTLVRIFEPLDLKKKSLHARTREEVHIFWGNTVKNVENQPA